MNFDGYSISVKQKRQQLARGLGWFSVGLGLLEFAAPRALSNLLGIRPRSTLLRLLGLREIANGVGLLTQEPKADWLKARVAGDAIDLSLLGAAFFAQDSDPVRLSCATAAVAGVTALDVLAAQEFSHSGPHQGSRPGHRWAGRVERSITVNRPAAELFDFWKNFEQLPRFMEHLVSVTRTAARQSHWVAKGPAGTRIEWDAEVIEERPSELLAWRSLENADVDHAGSVRFEPAPGGRGTIVRVKMQYRPPAGVAGAKLAKLLGRAPEQQIATDLLRFKQMMETGEIARTEGQPAGRSRSTSGKFDDLVRH